MNFHRSSVRLVFLIFCGALAICGFSTRLAYDGFAAGQSLLVITQKATTTARRHDRYGPPQLLGQLQDSSITESSGIVASRTTPGLFWTHNDSGDGPFIYSFDRQRNRRGGWQVT